MAIHYKDVALDDLRAYDAQKAALDSIREKLAALSLSADGLRSQLTNPAPVQGGASRTEDRLLDSIVERDRLRENYRAAKRRVDAVERGLACLADDERRVLLAFAREGRHGSRTADTLADLLSMDRSTVYRLYDRALYRFTVASYGILDL